MLPKDNPSGLICSLFFGYLEYIFLYIFVLFRDIFLNKHLLCMSFVLIPLVHFSVFIIIYLTAARIRDPFGFSLLASLVASFGPCVP